MMRLTGIALVACAAICGSAPAHAIDAQNIAAAARNAAWAKAYAIDCGSATKHPCPPSATGYENEFDGDPRLTALLQTVLPQRESWWIDGHAGSASVASIVREFIGVPDKLLVDGDRFVTATGCVPRDCGDGGMLWIDTGSHPALTVFLAHTSIESFKEDAGVHLWLYTSKPLNFASLPPDLLLNLHRWHADLTASVARLPPSVQSVFSEHVTLATLVQPNGSMRDLSYDMLFYKQNQPHAHTLGASK